MTEKKHRIFVYGSLKTGLYNHPAMDTSKLVCNDGFILGHLYCLGPFPAYKPPTGLNDDLAGPVYGELYEVDDETLRRLDSLEGHPDFYRRSRAIMVRGNDEAEVVETYVFTKDCTGRERLAHGNWGS